RCICACLSSALLRPPPSTLFPYTTLFRSHDADDRRVFDSIIVITDRRVLDRQLQATMRQLEQTLGVVENIDTTSRQLKEALEARSEEHTSELQSRFDLVCRLLLEKKNNDR